MNRVKTDLIKLKDIKHIENSRLRDQDEVSDLMHDIEQRGLLQNIGVRAEDNALIFGNRRVKAYEKLGYEEIMADFYDDMSDEDLLITNLAENIKRRDIGSIEIGRVCRMLNTKDMTNSEISSKLGISVSRVRSCIAAYEVTVGTAFEKLVIYGKAGIKSGISESLIWKIQNSLSRARKLSREDWNQLLAALESKELTAELISQLRKVLVSSPSISISDALDVLRKCRIVHVFFSFDQKELNAQMKKDKFNNEIEFIKHIVRNYNKDLIF